MAILDLVNIAAMTAQTKASLTDGQKALLNGYATANDGGGGVFYWHAGSSTTADGGTVFAADQGGTGRWKRIRDPGTGNGRWFGAKADGATNDATALNNTIAAARRVAIPSGTYRCTAAITPTTNTEIDGEAQDRVGLSNSGATVIESSAAKIIDLGTSGAHSVVLRGLHLKPVTADQANTYGIYGEQPVYLGAYDVVIKDQAVGIYIEKSQQHTYKRCYIRSCGQGMHFAADAGAYNVDWFNNLISIEDTTIIESSAGPNVDFQGQGLHVKNCDITGITNTGTRASVRIRAGSYDATIENFYSEPRVGQDAGGDVFLCEGGATRIKGGFCAGGGEFSRVANVISAKSGAIVIVEGVIGYDWFDNFVTADGAGTIVYVMPGCFGGQMVATNRFVETNGGKVIELPLDAGSFTATLTGCTTSQTGTVSYFRQGKIVTLLVPSITATSNSTFASLTGLPAALRPTASNQLLSACNVIDAGGNFTGGALVAPSGVINLYKANNVGITGFTNSGVKGIQGVQVFHYTLF